MKEFLLISRAVHGSRRALEELVRMYYEKIYTYIYYRVMDNALAEDLTQDVFMKLTKSIHSYRPGAPFSAYLYRIAHNTVVDYYRKVKQEEELSEQFPAPDMYKRFSDFKPVVGYSLGWDVLCSVMQFLPYTLGMALLVVLGNLFSQENTFSMRPVLWTAKHGRFRLLKTKLGLVFLVTTGLWILFQLFRYICVCSLYMLYFQHIAAAFIYAVQSGSACTYRTANGEISVLGMCIFPD